MTQNFRYILQFHTILKDGLVCACFTGVQFNAMTASGRTSEIKITYGRALVRVTLHNQDLGLCLMMNSGDCSYPKYAHELASAYVQAQVYGHKSTRTRCGSGV